jgi:hypothetical protein
LFAGNSTTEPITLVAKFTNISSEIILDSQNNLEYNSLIIDSKELDVISNSNNDTTIISNNDSMVTSNNYFNLGFDFGLVVGIVIVIAVAIGISLLFIYRQKNT